VARRHKLGRISEAGRTNTGRWYEHYRYRKRCALWSNTQFNWKYAEAPLTSVRHESDEPLSRRWITQHPPASSVSFHVNSASRGRSL